jgi:hypothetical protein
VVVSAVAVASPRDTVRAAAVDLARPPLSSRTSPDEIIGHRPAGIVRAVQRVGIKVVQWGGKHEHLHTADVMRVAQHANWASLVRKHCRA